MANRGVGSGSALYLYGVSRASKDRRNKVKSPGVDGLHQVEALPCGEFVCWVSPIEHAAFSRELESNMENLEWLALHGVRHQQVVGEIAESETVVPARFATLFSSETALRKDVEARTPALNKVFARINDADEWGVKVLVEEQPAVAAAVKKPSSGRDYLQQKAARIKKRPERNDREVEEFAAALEKVAAGSAPSGKVSGSQPGLLWQATYLVPRARRKPWEATLQQFVERWQGRRRVEVTGPWPPYSFVSDAK
jgi:Gas vesicle synthesis protein GvpL/GvpF